MTARRCLSALCLAAYALFCPGCACAPDRWQVGVRVTDSPQTGRWDVTEVNAQLSGPLPFRRSHE